MQLSRRPILVPTLIAAAAALVLAGCGGGSDGDESAGGDDRPSSRSATPAALVVCTSVPFEPAEYREDGKLVGYDIDIVRAVGDELDRDVRFEEVDFDAILDALGKGTCDAAISSMAITPEREERASFVPYLAGPADDQGAARGGTTGADPDAPPLGIAVRRDDDALRIDLEQTIAAMYEDGRMRSLLEQWDATEFLLDPPPAEPEPGD